MAIDTAEKRRAVAGITIGWGITPNALQDAEWRQEVAWSYSGILAGAGPGGPVIGDMVWVISGFPRFAIVVDVYGSQAIYGGSPYKTATGAHKVTLVDEGDITAVGPHKSLGSVYKVTVDPAPANADASLTYKTVKDTYRANPV